MLLNYINCCPTCYWPGSPLQRFKNGIWVETKNINRLYINKPKYFWLPDKKTPKTWLKLINHRPGEVVATHTSYLWCMNVQATQIAINCLMLIQVCRCNYLTWLFNSYLRKRKSKQMSLRVIIYLFVQTFCKFQLLQQFLLLVAEAVVLLRTRTLQK